MQKKWTEQKVRRYVRRHAKLTKVMCWEPWTYVEATVVFEFKTCGESKSVTLMCPGFAKCMVRDEYDRQQGIVNAWVAAYESLVGQIVLFQEALGPEEPAVVSQEVLRKKLKEKLEETEEVLEALKPCAYCGGAPSWNGLSNAVPELWQIQCGTCHRSAVSEQGQSAARAIWNNTKGDMVRLWDGRLVKVGDEDSDV